MVARGERLPTKLTIGDAYLAVKAELARLELRRRTEKNAPQTAEAKQARQAQDSLRFFIEHAWAYVEQASPLQWGWHLDVICGMLERVARGESKRVVFLLPPGTMKSLTVSVFAPAWEWTRNPSLRFLTFTYSDRNALRDSLRMRSLVQSAWYRRHFPQATLRMDQATKMRFDTVAGGWRLSSSVAGLATGEHPDRLLIDDPMKAGETLSAARRDQIKFWFDRTISTRLARDPAIVLVMQRLHEDDLAGHLEQMGNWEFVTLPMHFDPERADPRDPRTYAGELLWPDGLWNAEKVKEEETVLGPFGAASQLEQRPVPEGGGLFQRSWLPIVGAGPARAVRCRGWDTAATEMSGDYTVGVRVAVVPGGKVYIENVIRVQQGPGDVDALIKNTAMSDGYTCMIREEREGGSSGKAVTHARAVTLQGFDYADVSVGANKIQRANPIRAQAQAGNVALVEGDWNEDYLREVTAFPVGKHDDQVDATSCAYNALVGVGEGDLTWGS